jgi:hypothetical protein
MRHERLRLLIPLVFVGLRGNPLTQAQALHASLHGQFVDDSRQFGVPNVRAILTGQHQTSALIATTDTDGYFTFSDVAPGAYSLRAEKGGFFPFLPREINADQSGAATELGKLVLTRMRRISVTLQWRDREPASDANVALFPIVAGRADVARYKLDSTDDSGQLVFGRLRPGRYVLVILGSTSGSEPPPLLPQVGLPQIYPAGGPPFDNAIDLYTHENEDVHVTLEEIAGITVEGTVAPSATVPIGAEVTVALILADTPSPPVAQRTVRAGDRFRFLAVPPGQYWLHVFTHELARRFAPLVIDDSARSDIEILAPVRTGRDSAEANSQRAPVLTGIRLGVTSADFGVYGVSAGLTDESGFAMLSDLAGGAKYFVGVSRLPQGTYVASITQGETSRASGPFDFVAGGPPVLIKLRLDAGTVTGTVTDEDGLAHQGFVVIAPKDQSARDFFRSAETRRDGTFAISGVAPGDYDVFAFDRGEAADPRDLVYLATRDLAPFSFTIVANDIKTVRLKLRH